MPQRTLLNIKPDAIEQNLVGEILKRVEAKGFRIVAMDKMRLTRKEVEAFYAVHKGKYFYDRLIEYMLSGPCIPVVVAGENVIEGIRELIGNTDPEKAAEGTIRRDYARTVTINCVHASDSPESAEEEIAFFFSKRQLL